jgi:hypothetical protein
MTGKEIAQDAGFRPSTIGDFMEHGIVSSQLKYEKRKLYVRAN